MTLRIDQDHSRFREIVRGKIKQNLRKYITQGELIGRQGKDSSSPSRCRRSTSRTSASARQGQGGVGQGEGEPGDAARPGRAGSRARARPATSPGEHVLEVEITLEELAEILGEELELPRIEPKGKQHIVAEQGPLHRHPPAPAPSRCATSSAPSSRR